MFGRNKMKNIDYQRLIPEDEPSSDLSKQLQTIATNIEYSLVHTPLNTLTVTSAKPSAGKSFMAANIAATLASEEISVLIVDTNMRNPSLHQYFNETKQDGLSTLITKSSVTLNDVIQTTHINNLYYIPSGVIPPKAVELIKSKRMNQMIEEMKSHFNLVIFDTPPVLDATDAQIIASKTVGTIIIVPKEDVTRDELEKTNDLLNQVSTNILGAVVDMSKEGK